MKKFEPKKEPERIQSILDSLKKLYPEAGCALYHRSPFELLVSTILSAQCTDKRVNQVTPGLFQRYPNVQKMAGADKNELEELIRSTGFFHNKAKSILGASQKIIQDHHGKVPQTMEELTKLPGVGRKTANVVLQTAFGKKEGVVVDTHVIRLSHRLKLTNQKDPVKIEKDLMKKIPKKDWDIFSHWLMFHGRKTCKALRPRCQECSLVPLCPWGQAHFFLSGQP